MAMPTHNGASGSLGEAAEDAGASIWLKSQRGKSIPSRLAIRAADLCQKSVFGPLSAFPSHDEAARPAGYHGAEFPV